MFKIIKTDNIFDHLYYQMNNFFRIKKVKTFFTTKYISSKEENYFIDWKDSLLNYSMILNNFLKNNYDYHANFYHDIPELELFTNFSNLELVSDKCDFICIHMIKGSLNLNLTTDQNNSFNLSLNENDLLILEKEFKCVLNKTMSKKVLVSSFPIKLVENGHI
jgi:hypothetical protein